MNFSRSFTSVEYFFILGFVLIYGIYFFRIFTAAWRLKTSAVSSIFKFVVRFTYVGLMLLALLAPNFGITESEARASGKDIFLVFDVSKSMNAQDVEPSRLERAKNEMLTIVNRFNADRIGVMVFNSDAYIFAPLTFDQENIKNAIKSIHSDVIEAGSTNFNTALELLLDKFSKNTVNRSKVAVIISDGETHYNPNSSLMEKIKQANINVSFVGVGTLDGGKIPEGNTFKRDSDGEEIISRLDVESLSTYAKGCGGDYFILNDFRNDISKVMDKMSFVTQSSDDLNRFSVTYNKYVFFLLLALLFVSVDFLITVKVLKI